MSIQEVLPEQLAELLHHYQQALAPDFGCDSSEPTAESWSDVPLQERNRMVAAARLARLGVESRDRQVSRRYFAKPGEAEWGC